MKEKIIEIIRNACAIDEEVAPDSELKLLSLDSLTFVNIVIEIEDMYGIESMNSASSIGKQWEILLIVWMKN